MIVVKSELFGSFSFLQTPQLTLPDIECVRYDLLKNIDPHPQLYKDVYSYP